jgi:hypothetical protein
MMSIVAGLLYFGLIGWMAARRRHLLYILAFPIFCYSWRMVCAVYVDVSGPLYSVQLGSDIGGGYSAVALTGAALALLLPMLFVFRRSKLAEMRTRALLDETPTLDAHAARIAKLFFMLAAAYVALLYIELVNSGVVPMASGLERWEYTEDYGGPFHRVLMKYGNLFAFWLGLFHAQPKGNRGRFLILLLAVFFYLLLTGHRFSLFLSQLTFFLIPRGVQLIRTAGVAAKARDGDPRPKKDWWTIPLIVIVLVAMSGAAIYRSYTLVRTTDPGRGWKMFEDRVLVQQGELWVSSYERVFEANDYNPDWAVTRLFLDPIDPTRNTTIPFLMELDMGSQAVTAVEYGTYSGGFPEVFFELFGPVLGYLVLFVVSGFIAVLLRWLANFILRHRYLGVFACLWVVYAFLLTMTSGMLNYLIAWTFWVKVAGLLGVTVIYLPRLRAPRTPAMADGPFPEDPGVSDRNTGSEWQR